MRRRKYRGRHQRREPEASDPGAATCDLWHGWRGKATVPRASVRADRADDPDIPDPVLRRSTSAPGHLLSGLSGVCRPRPDPREHRCWHKGCARGRSRREPPEAVPLPRQRRWYRRRRQQRERRHRHRFRSFARPGGSGIGGPPPTFADAGGQAFAPSTSPRGVSPCPREPEPSRHRRQYAS